jgi:hypothetical protein
VVGFGVRGVNAYQRKVLVYSAKTLGQNRYVSLSFGKRVGSGGGAVEYGGVCVFKYKKQSKAREWTLSKMEIPVEPKTRSRRSGCDDTRSGPKTPIVGFPKQGRDTRMPGLKADRNSGDTVRGVNRRS